MQRRHFLATAALAAAPNVLTAAKTADPPLIVGHGSHRYRAEKNWSKADHAKIPSIMILDKDDKVISCPGGEAPRYKNGTLMALMKDGDLVTNGHDICVDNDENLYLCQWNSGKVPPYKLHRLPD